MKHFIASFVLLFVTATALFASGLENIIVEKYYVADQIDEIKSGGQLKAGSITYRVFVDMKPGYRFQAAYGIPGHPLRIATTSFFYNHTDLGSHVADNILPGYLNRSTVLLDSYLSVGAGAENMFAILKSADTTSAILNSDTALQNSDPVAGIPLKERDGLYYASPLPVVLMYGIADLAVNVFDEDNSAADDKDEFYTENGSWACLAGSIGLDTTNKVLIAQLTTDGELTFSLNIQIGTPNGGVENYVAAEPQGEEKKLNFLSYPPLPEAIKEATINNNKKKSLKQSTFKK